MKYIIEIADNQKEFVEEVLKTMTFIKNLKPVPSKNEITNKAILKSIEDYEKKKVKPTKINLKKLKLLLFYA